MCAVYVQTQAHTCTFTRKQTHTNMLTTAGWHEPRVLCPYLWRQVHGGRVPHAAPAAGFHARCVKLLVLRQQLLAFMPGA